MNSIQKLKEVDKIEVFVLMDNLSDPFSVSHPGMKFNEFQYQSEERGCRVDNGEQLCRACLGLSLWIRVRTEEKRFTILFDTGPDKGLAVENARRLGLDLREIDAVVLSHGHFDHISGLLSCLKEIGKTVPVYCHPNVFEARASRFRKTEYILSSVLREEDVHRAGGAIVKTKEPQFLFDSCLLVSGEISRTSAYETGVPGEMNFRGGQWVDEPLVIDEQSLIFNLRGKGTCIFTGCGHPGVVNTLRHAKDLTGEKAHLIFGGYHLAGPTFERRIADTIQDLKELDPHFLISGHCTGFKAQSALTRAFGDRHIPYGVGSVFRFNSLHISESM